MSQHASEPIPTTQNFKAEDALKDPTRLPDEFSAWLVRWLEGSSLQLPRSSVTGIDAICPIGAMLPYGGTATFLAANYPNWLICDGSAVSRTNYPLLFQACATTYGAGDGSTTFNLPALRDRIPWGLHESVAAVDTLGETGGSTAISTSNMPAHTHTGPSHTHPSVAGNFINDSSTQTPAAGGGGPAVPTGIQASTGAGGTGATGSAGSGTAYRPPYLAAPYIIRAA